MALAGRVAVVTGGSCEIGRGIAMALGGQRAPVVIAYRSNKVSAQNLLRQLQTEGAECFAVEADVTITSRVNPSNLDEKGLTVTEARRIRDARYPIGRPLTIDGVAAAVKFFTSEDAEYLAGQVLNVSGGWLI